MSFPKFIEPPNHLVTGSEALFVWGDVYQTKGRSYIINESLLVFK